MGFTDPYWGLRPRVYGPFLLVWNVMLIAFVLRNLFTAEVSRWVSLVPLVAYPVTQWQFRQSMGVEQLPVRRRNWLFIP